MVGPALTPDLTLKPRVRTWVSLGSRLGLAADTGVVDRHIDRSRASFDVRFYLHDVSLVVLIMERAISRTFVGYMWLVFLHTSVEHR